MQTKIESNKQEMKSNKKYYDEKMLNFAEDLKKTLASTVVPANRRAPPLDCGHSTKIGGMWNLKHDIRSTKLYELLIKIKVKGYTYDLFQPKTSTISTRALI